MFFLIIKIALHTFSFVVIFTVLHYWATRSACTCVRSHVLVCVGGSVYGFYVSVLKHVDVSQRGCIRCDRVVKVWYRCSKFK